MQSTFMDPVAASSKGSGMVSRDAVKKRFVFVKIG